MYLIVDLEATCWEIPKVPDLNEIIDIGVIVCDDEYNILDSWSSSVQPKYNKKLSSFCKKLTGIKQEEVDLALCFSEVMDQFQNWFKEKFSCPTNDVIWFTWGSWDLKCLTGDCNRNGIMFPFSEHRNLKDIYYVERNCDKTDKLSIKDILIREGIEFPNKLHRGITDALAAAKIARVVYLAIGRELVPPPVLE